MVRCTNSPWPAHLCLVCPLSRSVVRQFPSWGVCMCVHVRVAAHANLCGGIGCPWSCASRDEIMCGGLRFQTRLRGKEHTTPAGGVGGEPRLLCQIFLGGRGLLLMPRGQRAPAPPQARPPLSAAHNPAGGRVPRGLGAGGEAERASRRRN